MIYPLYIFLGILPSIIWLLYYLKKDTHPEPRLMILKIFFWGMLSALPAIFIEKGIFLELQKLSLSYSVTIFLNNLLGAALVEETLKYLVVRGKVSKSDEFDEPVDAMLYMIVAGLGFAAAENIFVMLGMIPSFLIHQTLLVLALRFVGAVFLHALCSAIVGFWLAVSFSRYREEKFRFVGLGLGIAICLHALFNFFIIKGGVMGFLIPIAIIIGLSFVVSLELEDLKKNYF